MNVRHILLTIVFVFVLPARSEDPWRFIVLADWHSAEKYTRSEEKPEWFQAAANADVAAVKMLKHNYQGDFILLPGDSNGGHWKGNTILKKGRLCYTGMVQSFEKGGYDKLLMAVGDHELGDNPWPPNTDKSQSQHLFRKSFSDAFNLDRKTGKSKYGKPIGAAAARPIGTIYENTSYAYHYKNTLIITVDVFRQDTASKTIGSQGTVTGSVAKDHYRWLEKVLVEGRKIPSIKHIFVQSHLPVLYPVRKANSSGMMMDDHADCDFWNLLRKHKVDIYFAGEVHANTVTKDPESDLIQLVSRGNFFSNFLTVDVTVDKVEILCHNKTGAKPSEGKYEKIGRLVLTKTDGKTAINSEGELALLDRGKPVMHFDFEERFKLSSRPVLGMRGKSGIKQATMIDGKTCKESFANKGAFSQQFDAHFTGVDLVEGPIGKAGAFTDKSCMAVFGMGPHYLDRTVSYALWVKTTSGDPMVLINTGSIWKRKTQNFMNLNLRDGKPELMISNSQRLVANARINDGNWHHIAVSRDKDGAKLSELSFYVDGKRVKTTLAGKDRVLSTIQSVRLSVGCFGYSRPEFKKLGVKPYTGQMDEVRVWARALTGKDIAALVKR